MSKQLPRLKTIISILFGAMLIVMIETNASERVALVVGNADYHYTPALENPANDAQDIAAQLQSMGFAVELAVDVNLARFQQAVQHFTSALGQAQVGLFFYAGHGMQVNGKNYLVPVDAKLKSEAALDFEVLDLATVMRQLEREVPTRIIILDACRDNPLAQDLKRSLGSTRRSAAIGQGLAEVQSDVGTLIGYSTAPNTGALDGRGQRNSPYTQALLNHMETPGLEIGQMLRRVRRDVLRATKQEQVPWESISLTHDFYFIPKPNRQSDAPFRDTLRDGSLGPEMITLTPDRFWLGDIQGIGRTNERPLVAIDLASAFAISRHEVTFDQYDRYCQATRQTCPNDQDWGRGNRPVINVSYREAKAYTVWLTQQTGQTYRLPTEAEWEFAARAGQTTSYSFGNDSNALCQYANGADAAAQTRVDLDAVMTCDDHYAFTAPVGSYRGNGWGIHDLHGNVWEWVLDGYSETAYSLYASKGYQPLSTVYDRYVIRGGSWSDPPSALRAAARNGVPPNYRASNLGFRVARSP